MKKMDVSALAKHFANVLRHNPELLENDRFSDLSAIIEHWFRQAIYTAPTVPVTDLIGLSLPNMRESGTLN